MLNLRDISIRNKLVLMQVVTSVIVLSVFFGVFIITDIKDYKARKVKSTASLAHVISVNSIPTILFQDNEAANAILAELRNSVPEIMFAGIYDKSHKIFASYTRSGTDSSLIPKAPNWERSEFTDKQLFVSDDIINNNEVIGKVMLEVDLSELRAIKNARYQMAIVLILGAVLFSFLVAFVIQLYISKRLLYLVDRIKNVSKTGDYGTPIADKGKDEISTLIKVYNKLMEQVKESQQKKDEFIGIASHELKTPLTGIKGYLDLLDSIEDKQPHKQFVQKGLESVQKLERLIKDLLDVSKIQSGQLQLEMKEFNVDEFINETIASIQIVSGNHSIVRENSLNGQMIFADRQRIEQVLINLLSNAVKYSPDGNQVIVGSKMSGTDLIIKVRDYGIGIAEEETLEIFERFYRTKNSSVHISGFGLGLYICKDIVMRHGGKIWVEKEQKGSSFYFSLPVKHPVSDTNT